MSNLLRWSSQDFRPLGTGRPSNTGKASCRRSPGGQSAEPRGLVSLLLRKARAETGKSRDRKAKRKGGIGAGDYGVRTKFETRRRRPSCYYLAAPEDTIPPRSSAIRRPTRGRTDGRRADTVVRSRRHRPGDGRALGDGCDAVPQRDAAATGLTTQAREGDSV